ncbi:MAG: hypothetical protein ABIC04_01680 [Nanoarchaeota archaeon]
MQEIVEGKAKIAISISEKISKEMPVFYNPVMKFNRDISILLLNSIKKTDLTIALPLAASGIRGIRFLLELNNIKEVHFNDHDKDFKKNIRKNLRLNNIAKKAIIHSTDANLFLLNSTGFNYIDIDPFGSPNAFLDSAVNRINREGILAVTATDTSALCGTYPKACKRKYWATPLRNELMHEIGLRILIRKVQLIGAQFEKALIPIFSYSKDHYMRIFFRCIKGKSDVDAVLNQHDFYDDAGPIWTGPIFDNKLVSLIIKNNKDLLAKDNELGRFFKIVHAESKINIVGFYNIHKIVKRNKLHHIPRKQELITKIKKLKYKVSETHFCPEGIRSDISLEKFLRLLTEK